MDPPEGFFMVKDELNKTISDAEAMKKISDMLAEIREKEKIE